jgi:hypothetical protein
MVDIIKAADGLSRLTIIPSYIILALTFIYGYLRPKEYTEWLVVSSNTYMVSLVLMIFISAFSFGLGLFLPDILATMGIGTEIFLLIIAVPSVLIYLFVFLSIIKSKMKISGGTWQISFALFVFAMAQEVLSIINASRPSGSLMNLEFLSNFDILSLPGLWIMGWYFGGAFLVPLGGSLFGKIIDRSLGSISASHIPTMKEKFGQKAPYELKFMDGSSAKGDYGAGVCAATGVIYSFWMLLRHLIFP